MKKINFKVTPSTGTQIYAIAVDGDGIYLNNQIGSIKLKEGETHILQYYLLGTSGGKLKIEGRDVAKNLVVEVKETKIPPGKIRHAFHKSFKV
jgi:hypothetical protein